MMGNHGVLAITKSILREQFDTYSRNIDSRNIDACLLTVAGAPSMTAACRIVGMTSSTALATIVLPFGLNCFAEIYNAKARFTSTFHLSYGCHKNLLAKVKIT